MTWQPIETAPKDGTWVLLYGGKDVGWYGDDTIQTIVTAFWRPSYYRRTDDQGQWMYTWWEGDWRSEMADPTHWMPLPTPPIDE